MPVRFRKSPANPIIPRIPGSFHSVHVANPDVVEFRGEHLMIYRGQDERRHDQLGVATGGGGRFNPTRWSLPDTPCIRVDENPAAFDSGHILDPAAIVVGGQLYVYYTAHSADWQSWNVPSHIGLAISDDGRTFRKHGEPVIEGMAPEIVAWNGKFHLILQRLSQDGSLAFYLAESRDGLNFGSPRLILEPTRTAGQFDAYSISTARIWQEEDWFLMAYGGCSRFPDYPEAIGLARSRDLAHWERYPENPVLRRGRAGSWDEGALWFATGYQVGDTTYMYYEGAGRSPAARGTRALARRCRNEDYGGYADIAFSQVGMAVAHGRLANWD